MSSQNLRDKAAALERTVGNVSRDIVRNVGRADGARSERGNKENAEIVTVESSDQNANELRISLVFCSGDISGVKRMEKGSKG